MMGVNWMVASKKHKFWFGSNHCPPRKNDISDGQMALWQIMGMEASVNKHKQVKHIMAPTTLLIT
jgi:hypothetical protein